MPASPTRSAFSRCWNALGAVIVERRAFDDHHVFSEAEARDLLDTRAARQRRSRHDGKRSGSACPAASGASRELRTAFGTRSRFKP